MQPRQLLAAALLLAGLNAPAHAMDLKAEKATAHCGASPPVAQPVPAAAHKHLPGSQVVSGQRNVALAWLGSATLRYPHGALGSREHAGSLHALVRTQDGLMELAYVLPLHRVFEDRIPRLVDLDADGRDEILLVESDAVQGSALVVLQVRVHPTPALVELARGPYTGSTFRWLNPVGVADFDGDGRLDVASVTTPHIGGVLTLHHLRPPRLEPYATAMDVSNHRMGQIEQQLAAVVHLPGLRPTILVPDMSLRSMHALRWESPGQWRELGDLHPLPARLQRLTPLPGGACAWLDDGSWWRLALVR
ncbi:MAG: VCBS repeat-containing protein [Ramlibacter sp.]|nr:VCBS repeat-containing protein [Ramlibacter sp.]